MHMLLPMIYQRCLQLLVDVSEASVLLQKQILKIFFALVQYFLPLDLISKETFAQWMDLFRTIVDRPVPDIWNFNQIFKKLYKREFSKTYGSPNKVSKEYREFADYYLHAFSGGILEVMLKVLLMYKQKLFVSSRVLQQALNYINQAVNHAFSWKFLKVHMMPIIQDVIFPLMCYTDQDEDLWNTDPHEYIRLKFDVFEDFISPVTAAQSLLHSAVKKRKEILPNSMGFVMSILTDPNSNPRQKDGALHMVGTVANILMKKPVFKEQMETMLVTYVYPEFESPHGFMRARACWVLHYFSEIKFQNETNLIHALGLTQHCLLNDKDMPVKVEAAIALQMLITNQEKAKRYIEPKIKPIALELLNIMRETENDDLTTVMQKIVCTYSKELMPIAVEMTRHLVRIFQNYTSSKCIYIILNLFLIFCK
ncbi:importin-7-like [Centruroides sculpturatus]|uniref:importin-7-like n=1 Tax=Centruroides sculpturatus TaxID=218467 RepID=UPI000C6D41F1|nr:importin-7-like [Centruroides sculpturatus]